VETMLVTTALVVAAVDEDEVAAEVAGSIATA
jgi:hypothetical protein